MQQTAFDVVVTVFIWVVVYGLKCINRRLERLERLVRYTRLRELLRAHQ